MLFIPAFIPSPSQSVWQLGPVPLRAYAFFILLGIFVAVWLGNKRWIARGGLDGQVADIAMWAVPFGIIGGRIYHVATDWELYFSEGGKGFLGAFRIWEGGLGIWGALALGGVGAWIGAKRLGVPFAPFADSIAPGIAFAQAIGRLGNWFNQELFGKPTTLPWGLEVSAFHTKQAGYPVGTLFHPTFLYESLACLALCGILLLLDKSVKRPGYLFLYYTAGYTLFRFFIEGLRIDPAHSAGGLRLNQWVSLVVFTVSVSVLALARRTKSDLPA